MSKYSYRSQHVLLLLLFFFFNLFTMIAHLVFKIPKQISLNYCYVLYQSVPHPEITLLGIEVPHYNGLDWYPFPKVLLSCWQFPEGSDRRMWVKQHNFLEFFARVSVK